MKFCSMNCFIETGIVEDSFANTDFLASKVSKKTFSNEPTSLLENPNGNKFRVYYQFTIKVIRDVPLHQFCKLLNIVKKKIAIYCRQGSGTLRQQSLMMH